MTDSLVCGSCDAVESQRSLLVACSPMASVRSMAMLAVRVAAPLHVTRSDDPFASTLQVFVAIGPTVVAVPVQPAPLYETAE